VKGRVWSVGGPREEVELDGVAMWGDFVEPGLRRSRENGVAGHSCRGIGYGLLRGVAKEDDVGVGVATEQGELGAVEGPVKIDNLLRREIGNLSSRRAVERLEPEIGGIFFAKRIEHCLPVVGKTDETVGRALERFEFYVLRVIEGKQRQQELEAF
jgi:hypothetical protein